MPPEPSYRPRLGADSPPNRPPQRRGRAGFSLIELLIVVAVIAIILGIAVPSFQSSKKAANEAAAISYMRTWTSAQELYLQKFGRYADADQQLVEEGFIGVGKSDQLGYTFSIDNGANAHHRWWGRGGPDKPGVTGDRFFYIDSKGVIRYSLGGPAGPNSPALGK